MQRYGIDLDQYDELLTRQKGVCAVCARPPRGRLPLHVDHCHDTGRIRGLLCVGCNRAIGILGDTYEGVARAAAYLAAEGAAVHPEWPQ